ncbi:Bug family tripartite tricarboxylate transporter substrate binding protein [Pseudoroseomonas globiformis]|uniref:Bug family tripartite tricarboxylate transporter substrate binding protein n=1 Tax=Teichococcus globiformis TaxID=2307229 RepID=A0ABV7G9F5_9PROT
MTSCPVRRRGLLAAAALLAAPACLRAEAAYPARPVRVIVPAAAGGQLDIMARLASQALAQELGQPFVVDNRVGANGAIGISAAAQEAADGYTLMCGVAGGLLLNPIFDRNVTFDVLRDFAPVSQFGLSPNCLYVRSGLHINSLAALIDHAKRHPGELTFASNGAGTIAHVYGELLKQSAGIDMLHVPFKSAPMAMQELIAGRVDVFIIDFSTGDPAMREGAVRGLAVTGPARWPLVANIPTFLELGTDMSLIGWSGMFAPRGTPKTMIDRLSTIVQGFIRQPETRERMLKMGLLPTGTDAEAFRQALARDQPRWRAVIEASGAKPDNS